MFSHFVCPRYCSLGTASVLDITQGHKGIYLHCAQRSIKKKEDSLLWSTCLKKKKLNLWITSLLSQLAELPAPHTGLANLIFWSDFGYFWNFPQPLFLLSSHFHTTALCFLDFGISFLLPLHPDSYRSRPMVLHVPLFFPTTTFCSGDNNLECPEFKFYKEDGQRWDGTLVMLVIPALL